MEQNQNDSNRHNLAGRWVVRYDPQDFEYRSILEMSVEIDDFLNRRYALTTRGPNVTVYVSKQNRENAIFHEPGSDCFVLKLKSSDFSSICSSLRWCEEKIKLENLYPDGLTCLTPGGQLKKIGLSCPALSSDRRWDSVTLTAAFLYLGSALRREGFEVTVHIQPLPGPVLEPQLRECDLIGFTLYEDLFLQVKPLFSQLNESYTGLLAAGGPMVTLEPLQAAYHLPEVNVFVRGEGELVFPGLIRAIDSNRVENLLDFGGILFQVPGILILSGFNQINRPAEFSRFGFQLDFLEKKHLEHGLEINVSRGCKRGCIFCSSVQGKPLRKLPLHGVEELLGQFSKRLETSGIETPHCRTVNINDDDILQDLDFAGDVFGLLEKCGFRLWGIQTSVDSFFENRVSFRKRALDLVSKPSLFVDNSPLVWLGTDAFLEQRGKKLAKIIPSEEQFYRLLEEFEGRGIKNYHYWISSDYEGDWEEFTRELSLIYRCLSRFRHFGLIAHAPFLVPYPTTPLFKLLQRSTTFSNRVKYKKILESRKKMSCLSLPLVDHVETPHDCLNRLLNNEKLQNRLGFFDYLKKRDYVNALITVYDFLKQERIGKEFYSQGDEIEGLKKLEVEIESSISSMM